jgi:hypothetical protein
VDRQLIVEIEAVATMLPVYDVQVLTYLRMSGLRIGLLFNFPARLLQDGLRRLSSEPLRAAPWFFVVSVLNACDRPDRTALSKMTTCARKTGSQPRRTPLQPSVWRYLRAMNDAGHDYLHAIVGRGTAQLGSIWRNAIVSGIADQESCFSMGAK